MLGKSVTYPMLNFGPSVHYHVSSLAPNVDLKISHGITPRVQVQIDERRVGLLLVSASKREKDVETQALSLDDDEERKMWKACREALTALEFSIEEKDKILGKAFGYVHSPYWSEERVKQVPMHDVIIEILDYLRSLGLSEDDLRKILKKFPEVLGCSRELRNNVEVLEVTWGIKGKSLRNLLLRNPKVLGYNVDCKGDCLAQCTRCWVRF